MTDMNTTAQALAVADAVANARKEVRQYGENGVVLVSVIEDWLDTIVQAAGYLGAERTENWGDVSPAFRSKRVAETEMAKVWGDDAFRFRIIKRGSRYFVQYNRGD